MHSWLLLWLLPFALWLCFASAWLAILLSLAEHGQRVVYVNRRPPPLYRSYHSSWICRPQNTQNKACLQVSFARFFHHLLHLLLLPRALHLKMRVGYPNLELCDLQNFSAWAVSLYYIEEQCPYRRSSAPILYRGAMLLGGAVLLYYIEEWCSCICLRKVR